MRPSDYLAFLMAIVAICIIPPPADAESRNLSGRWQATNTAFTGGDMPVEGGYADGKLMLAGSTTSGPHPGCSSISPPHSSRPTK
jgi:hypothetical protein